MLVPANPSLYNQAINAPHQPAVRVSVLDGKGVFLSEIPILDGAVSATLSSQVTRNADITIDPALSPADAADLLYPAGNRLYIERGIDYCPTRDLLPVFHGRIETVWDNPRQPSRIRAVDLAADIRDANFVRPENSIVGAAITEEFQRLIIEGLPSATFGDSDLLAATVGPQTWDTDRAQALDDLANAVGSFWYTLPDGRFVMRRVPWSIPRSVQLTLTDSLQAGECSTSPAADPSGLFLRVTEATRERSRNQVYNVISVSYEHVDGSRPLSALVQDADPASPTFVGGNFGVKVLLVRTDIARSLGQVQQMAAITLTRTKALTDGWTLEAIPDARIELGDCVQVTCNKVSSIQVVSALRIPLGTRAKMAITTRALIPELVALS